MDKNIDMQSLSTEELTLMVEASIGKTENIETNCDTSKVINTETAQLPISLSSPAKIAKATDLDGGITKTVGVSIDGGNIVFANVRVSGLKNNSLVVNDDGLYVPPANSQGGDIDETMLDQLLEQKKEEVVLRNYNGVLFKYEQNAIVININGADKIRVSENGVDFIL